MLNILSAENSRRADAYTIENEPILSIDLMERAATACADWLMNKYSQNFNFYIFAGTGNNGGDAIAIAKLLRLANFNVTLFVIEGNYSQDNTINQGRYQKHFGKQIQIINSTDFKLPVFSKNSVIVEGLFGSGLKRTVTGLASWLIEELNNADAFRVAIDIPSGLFDEDNHLLNEDLRPCAQKVFFADYTLAIEIPFLSLLLPENEKFVGQWIRIPIGINASFAESLESNYKLIEKNDVSNLLKKRAKFAHKGDFGHALIVAGKKMSFGAAVLASRATVKSGVGLCTAHIASSGNDIMQISLPEAMLSLDDEADFITKIPSDDKYNAIGIGPGIGTNIQTIAALVSFLNENKKPLVIDADGINCLAMVNNFLELLPQNTILTPHMKEFDRMFGNHNSVYERLQTQKKISKKYGVIIVLKGAHTAVSNSNGDIWFNTMGNPGMATGGSGDVLTGIVTGLRAGSYTAFDAALLGVYIHGLAGDLALVDESHETLIASDIISHLSNAFKFVK